MDRVARNELPATVLQDMQPAFVQARGTTYSNQFAEITMRFFTGMIHISTAYSDELADAFQLNMNGQPLQPPQLNVTDPVVWYQQVNDYAIQLNERAAKTYQTLLQRVSSGEVSPEKLQGISSSYMEQHYPTHLRRLSVLYFDLLNGLNDLYTGYQMEFLQGVLSSNGSPDSEFALNLTGLLGEKVTASITLTNTEDVPSTIHCTASDIRRADGVGPAFTPQITLEPESIELQPEDEAHLSVTVQLLADDFEVDVFYVGTLHIIQQGEPRFEVPLHIKATSPTRDSETPEPE